MIALRSRALVACVLALAAVTSTGCASAPPASPAPVTTVDVMDTLKPVPVIALRDGDPTPPRRADGGRRRYAFEGTWRADDGSIWKLSETSFYLRFNHNGAQRENYGHILEVDEARGHFVIAYDRSVEDGRDVTPPGERGYVTYVIEGDSIRKWVQSSLPFHDAGDEKFVRVADDR